MHIVISWDIKAEGDRWNKLDDALRKAIGPYSWVRPLTTFYIVKIPDPSYREIILNNMLGVAKPAPETIHIVISPVMSSGTYTGYLPQDMWQKINERTQP